MTRLIAGFAMLAGFAVLAACSSPRGPDVTSQAEFGDYVVHVRGALTKADRRSDASAMPLMVVFSWSDRAAAAHGGATEADFVREAELRGTTVEIVKRMLGKDAYVAKNGRLAVCIYLAKEKGLCSKPLGLSIAQRADMARQVINASTKCRWIGFNPAFHASRAVWGAQNDLLWVRADCRRA